MRAFALAIVWLVACGPNGRNNGDDTTGDGGSVCPANGTYCVGNDVYQCNSTGTDGTLSMSCPADMACSNGACKTPCQAAEDHPSNVGCDFWAVDLDNEAFNLLGASNDAAAQQFSVVSANDNDYAVTVTVTKNAAKVGQALAETQVVMVTVPPKTASRIDLPQREVDGSMQQNGTYAQNSGSGTFVSPHGYHVLASGPVVVYQFNPIVQQFSNDASTLIPKQALGNDYIVLGYPTANPCGNTMFPMPSIPDHTSVTIMADQDNTTVTINPTHPITASAGDSGIPIARTAKGTPLVLTINRYTVVNLESDQITSADPFGCINTGQDGDFTGTEVKSDKPVAVFSSAERGIGFGGAPNVVYPPDWDSMTDDICCTDHLEEQMFPVTALGQEFAIARSPIRSTDPTWTEPDIVRVVGTVDGTTITTNLPAPFASFTINRAEKKTFAATKGFTLLASAAVEVGSFLVSQHFVKHGYIGDPSQITLPAAEQFRKEYVFFVPSTFQDNYIVIAKPTNAAIVLDGAPLMGTCTSGPIGTVGAVDYDQITCKLPEGHHLVSADMPFGLSVYGYYNVGSYAFVGGSDIKIINPIL